MPFMQVKVASNMFFCVVPVMISPGPYIANCCDNSEATETALWGVSGLALGLTLTAVGGVLIIARYESESWQLMFHQTNLQHPWQIPTACTCCCTAAHAVCTRQVFSDLHANMMCMMCPLRHHCHQRNASALHTRVHRSTKCSTDWFFSGALCCLKQNWPKPSHP